MDEVFADFRDVDRSFVREFQTGGFSARVFELSLFAYLGEQGYELDRISAGPDFIIREPVPFAIEATTANPPHDEDVTRQFDPDDSFLNLVPKDLRLAEREFVFQVGKALRRKLTKRDARGRPYWEQPDVDGLPFVIALEVFHSISSLLSGVLFSNSQTAAKFNRIGTERGYGPPDVAMVRMGAALNPEPDAVDPQLFGYVVVPDTEYFETFSEGLHLIHNPWASNPLPVGVVRDVTEHQVLEDGRVEITASRLDPFMSQTNIFTGPGAIDIALGFKVTLPVRIRRCLTTRRGVKWPTLPAAAAPGHVPDVRCAIMDLLWNTGAS